MPKKVSKEGQTRDGFIIFLTCASTETERACLY